MFIYHKDGGIIGVSDYPISMNASVLEVSDLDVDEKELIRNYQVKDNSLIKKDWSKPLDEAKIAFVCVWNIQCGIATYSEFLVNKLRSLGHNVKVFCERYPGSVDDDLTKHCWSRGEDLSELIKELKEYNPDYVCVQHEYGIFPDARHWSKLISFLNNYRYAVAFHSVYWHKDKTVCEAICKNIIVHSEAAKQVLLGKGISAKITVIPHGCVDNKDIDRLWNIYRSPHTILQFGFGFEYKGWDVSLEAVRLLKNKYPEIFYLIMFSESDFSLDYHNSQFAKIEKLIAEKGISKHVAAIRGFQKEEVIDSFLRTVKVAVFPYTSHPDHIVYGSTGAARIAMSNGTPVVVSKLPLFYDLEGVVPRISTPEELATELDRLFSDSNYYNQIRDNVIEFVKNNSWEIVAKKYLAAL